MMLPDKFVIKKNKLVVIQLLSIKLKKLVIKEQKYKYSVLVIYMKFLSTMLRYDYDKNPENRK